MAMISMRPANERGLLSRCVNRMQHRYASGRSSINGCSSLLAMLAIALMLCPHAGSAQELAATLSGVVTDTSGAVIPHASVTITLNGVNGFSRAVESDGNGNYVNSTCNTGPPPEASQTSMNMCMAAPSVGGCSGSACTWDGPLIN